MTERKTRPINNVERLTAQAWLEDARQRLNGAASSSAAARISRSIQATEEWLSRGVTLGLSR